MSLREMHIYKVPFTIEEQIKLARCEKGDIFFIKKKSETTIHSFTNALARIYYCVTTRNTGLLPNYWL